MKKKASFCSQNDAEGMILSKFESLIRYEQISSYLDATILLWIMHTVDKVCKQVAVID